MKKILIIIYIVIFIALSYYVVTLFIGRNETKKHEPESKPKISEETHTDATPPKIPDTEVAELPNEQKYAAYVITREDCDSECVNIKDADKKSYCNQICGLTSTSQNKTCDKLSGLDKDYCLRDNAVQQRDIEKCKNINDSGITDQCKKRIQEDLIDEIM